MIPTDQIEILVAGTTNSYVSSGSDNTLVISSQAEEYAFSDFTGPNLGFLAQGPTSGTPVVNVVYGEGWHLATWTFSLRDGTTQVLGHVSSRLS